MSERRPKIKDIALRAGVSPATVSRALSDSDLVTEATRERVHDIARALNYRPNVSARNLRTRKAMAVLMVVRDVGNPFYLDIFKGIEATARAAGYSVLMGNTENDPGREQEYFSMLRDGHADGMILMTGKLPLMSGDNALDLSDLAVVAALEVLEDFGLPHVKVDNVGASRDAVQHLIDLGHRRIAHITGPLPELMSADRHDGYRQALQQAGIAATDGYEQRGNYLLPSGQAACRALFALPVPPTAIFCANDEMAYGAVHELRRLGRDVPGDVSVIGFDDLYLSQAFYPPLTTVSQPRTAIGRAAMQLLLKMLAGEHAPGETVTLATELKLRDSTAAPKG